MSGEGPEAVADGTKEEQSTLTDAGLDQPENMTNSEVVNEVTSSAEAKQGEEASGDNVTENAKEAGSNDAAELPTAAAPVEDDNAADGKEEPAVSKLDKLEMSLDELVDADRRSEKGHGGGWNKVKSNKWEASNSKQSWASGGWQNGGGQEGWAKKEASSGTWSGTDSKKWTGGNNWNSNDKWSNSSHTAGSSWNSSGQGQGWSSQKSSSWNNDWQSSKNTERRSDWKGSYSAADNGRQSYDQKGSWGSQYDQRSSDRGYERPQQHKGYDRGYDRPPPQQHYDRDPPPARRHEERDYAYASASGRSAEVYKEDARPAHREPRTIAVGNIEKLRVDKRDIEKAFDSVGRVERSTLSGSLAYITFYEPKDARDAVRRFNGGQLNDQTINVYFAEPGGFDEQRGRVAGGRSRTPPGHRSSARSSAHLPPQELPPRGVIPDRRRPRSLTPRGARVGGSPGARRPRR